MPVLPAAWRVHRALPADAARLTPLCAEHAAYEQCEFEAPGHTERLQAALHSGRVQAWWLEPVQTGEAMGYASVTLDWSTLQAQPFAHLDCLYLREPVRGQGAGRLLWAAATHFARTRGCATLQWQTPPWNQGAIRFYRRLGAQASAKARFALAL